MGTGYTAVDILKRWEGEEQKEVDSLKASKKELKKLKKERDSLDQKLIDLEEDLKSAQSSLEFSREEQRSIEERIKKLENIIREKEDGEAQDLISKLEGMGYQIFKKDNIDSVCLNFPNLDRIFGIKGTLLFNGEPISNKFHKHNFDQLYGKRLVLTDIKYQEIEGQTSMSDWLKEHRFQGVAGVDTKMLEKLLDVSFLTNNGVESFSEKAYIELHRLNKQYDNEEFSPFYKLEFSLREYKPYKVRS